MLLRRTARCPHGFAPAPAKLDQSPDIDQRLADILPSIEPRNRLRCGVISHGNTLIIDELPRRNERPNPVYRRRKIGLVVGHATLQSTEIYLRADPAEKLEMLGALAPLGIKPGR